MPTDLQDRPDTTGGDLDPAQQHYDDVFDKLTSAEHMAKDGKSPKDGLPEADGASSQSEDGGAAGTIAKGVANSALNATPLGFWKKAQSTFLGTKTRRNSTIGGGIVGLILSAFSIGSLWFAGPFEIVHIAQFLTKSHFQVQQDQGDIRMGKLYRFVRGGGDVGETRIGWIGSHYRSTMVADMTKIGLEPKYSSTKIMEGFTIDTTKDGPYKGMSEKEIKAHLEANGVGTDGMTFKDGKAEISTKGFFGKNGGRAANRFLVKEMGYSKISGALRVRILNKYGMVTWHPLKKLDAKINDKLLSAYDEWKKDREERYKTGVGEADVHGTAMEESKDENGKATQNPTGDTAAANDTVKTPTKSAEALKAISESKGASIAGGLAAVQALICGLRELATGIDDVRYAQVVMPLIRMGMDAVTVGNQVMSGEDVDPQTVKFVSKSFTGTDPTTKQQTSWNQAASIQAQMGHNGSGIDAPETYKNIAGGPPDWLAWTDQGWVSQTCSTGGKIIGGVVSIGLGVISGGFLQMAAGAIGSALIVPKVMSAATNFLAGEAVNVDASGAEYGSAIDYGSALGANAMALQFGGAPLTTPEVAQLNNERDAEDSKEFATKSFAYRVFDIHDNRTLASKMIDGSTILQPQNVASTFGSLLTNIGSFLKAPAMLLTAHTHADTTFNYGFKQFGFSQTDMDNSLVANPYENADAVARILDGPDGQPQTSDDNQDYIQRAKDCFGVDLSYGDQGWQAVTDPMAGKDPGKGINIYAQDYNPNNKCRDAGNNDWLRVRFFIFDMGQMEGWACFQGDTTSCQHDGVEDAPGSTGGTNFRIATFNVHGASHTGDDYKTRMDRSIATITSNNLDIIGFQEFQGPQKSYFIQKMSDTYDMFPRSTANDGHISENSIAWNKSKFKLADSPSNTGVQPNLVYFDGSKLDAPWVKLQDIQTGQQFYVLNTHDPANTGDHPGQQGYRYKDAQAHVDFIKQKGSDGTPILFTGDFNSGYTLKLSGNGTALDNKAENLTYCVMTSSAAINDAYDVYKNRPAKCPNPQVAPDNRYGGIDHIFITQGLTATNYSKIASGDASNGSDHPTVFVDTSIPASSQGIANAATAATPGADFVGNDGFGGGWCTDYVKYILGRHSTKYHGGSMGDGKDFANNLGHLGYTVNHTPAVHAVVSFPGPPYGFVGDRYAGHVALVAKINGDGSIVVEEANFSNKMAYGTHTVKAGEVGTLTYAHTEVGWH